MFVDQKVWVVKFLPEVQQYSAKNSDLFSSELRPPTFSHEHGEFGHVLVLAINWMLFVRLLHQTIQEQQIFEWSSMLKDSVAEQLPCKLFFIFAFFKTLFNPSLKVPTLSK